MESRPSDPTAHHSKEELALSSLDGESFAPPPRRRIRRRRRSLRRRIIDGLMPFCILTGMALFAAGMVQIVEIGAAGQSKTKRDRENRIVEVKASRSFDYEVRDKLRNGDYGDLLSSPTNRPKSRPKPKNQVAYQLSLEIDAQRDRIDPFAIPGPRPAGSAELMDWSLLEPGSEDPRSTLQRGIPQR